MAESVDDTIMAELKAIRQDLEYIKAHMVDADMILTPEEMIILKQSVKEMMEGKTRTLAELKRDRGEPGDSIEQ